MRFILFITLITEGLISQDLKMVTDLKTETPTMEYIHSLCALASQTPLDLQPILECTNLEQLLQRTTKLLESDIKHE